MRTTVNGRLTMLERDLPEITAAQLSAFDQAFAHSAAVLDELLAAHRTNNEAVAAAGLPEAASIFGLSRYLLEDMTFEAVVSICTVAIVRIDRALKEGGK